MCGGDGEEDRCALEGRLFLTTSQGRGRLPAGDLEGVVPGPYAHAHAQRLPSGVTEGATWELDVLTCGEDKSEEEGRCAVPEASQTPVLSWSATRPRLLAAHGPLAAHSRLLSTPCQLQHALCTRCTLALLPTQRHRPPGAL